ncbi:MAG: YafY family transcriptional regulator [Sneathiella sp.]|nr:YafY family transcriptional regulator [Sneathiella sp.]
MRRADRLFQIIQIMQRRQTAITAQEIAEELEVSLRTIYRDIQDLMSNRVPIRGERGTGYIFEKGYTVPPLMFNEEEIDAIMLGVHWVRVNGDRDISRAAEDILTKIESVLPEDRRNLMHSARQVVPEIAEVTEIKISMPVIRQAIREQYKVRTQYRTLKGDLTHRILCPLITVFFQDIQVLVAWCELRNDFRNFRMDRFESLEKLETPFSRKLIDNLDAYLESQRNSGKRRHS